MADTIWQLIISSGVLGLVGSLVVSRLVSGKMDRLKRDRDLEKEERYLMMCMLRKSVDMTQLMAQKLHDAGIINGDLEALNRASEDAEKKYEDLLLQRSIKR